MYLCRRFSGARQSEIRALIAFAGKIIAEDLAALGNLRSGLSLRRRQIVAADTRRVEKSMGRLGAGPPYDRGKGQITRVSSSLYQF